MKTTGKKSQQAETGRTGQTHGFIMLSAVPTLPQPVPTLPPTVRRHGGSRETETRKRLPNHLRCSSEGRRHGDPGGAGDFTDRPRQKRGEEETWKRLQTTMDAPQRKSGGRDTEEMRGLPRGKGREKQGAPKDPTNVRKEGEGHTGHPNLCKSEATHTL